MNGGMNISIKLVQLIVSKLVASAAAVLAARRRVVTTAVVVHHDEDDRGSSFQQRHTRLRRSRRAGGERAVGRAVVTQTCRSTPADWKNSRHARLTPFHPKTKTHPAKTEG
jgi:hypothetical protein